MHEHIEHCVHMYRRVVLLPARGRDAKQVWGGGTRRVYRATETVAVCASVQGGHAWMHSAFMFGSDFELACPWHLHVLRCSHFVILRHISRVAIPPISQQQEMIIRSCQPRGMEQRSGATSRGRGCCSLHSTAHRWRSGGNRGRERRGG